MPTRPPKPLSSESTPSDAAPSDESSDTPSAEEEPASTPTLAEPNVGATALKVGEWREGSIVRSRVSQFVQPADAQLPTYLVGDGSAEGALAQIELCIRKSCAEPVGAGIWDMFAAYDRNGGQYTRASSSWDEWPPLPQLPTEINVQPGRCASGWLLLNAPPATKITTVEMSDGNGVVAEWQVG